MEIPRQTIVQQPGLKLRIRVFSEREAQHPSFTDIKLFSLYISISYYFLLIYF